MSWGPAFNWVAHILATTDEESKDGQEHHGVQVVEAIHPIIVQGRCELGVGEGS